MKGLINHSILKAGVSLVLVICCLALITLLYADIAESIVIIRNSRAIQQNPDALKLEIDSLIGEKAALQSKFERLVKLQDPSLEVFNRISKENGLKLTGVNLKSKSVLKLDQRKSYSLIFSGRITAALNALYYIENNLHIGIESVKMYPNEADNKLVDLSLLVVFPE